MVNFFNWLAGIKEPRRSKRCRVYVNYQGYIMRWYPGHPRAWTTGYVLLHYYLWERYHKACLLKHSKVFHKDRNKLNNEKENLVAIYFIKASIST
jgi:hypothetical protein